MNFTDQTQAWDNSQMNSDPKAGIAALIHAQTPYVAIYLDRKVHPSDVSQICN